MDDKVFHYGLSSSDLGCSFHVPHDISALFVECQVNQLSAHYAVTESEILCIDFYIVDLQVSPVYPSLRTVRSVRFSVLHYKAHVMDLYLPDVEYFLFLRNPWRLRLPDAEYSGKIIFVPVFVHVLEHEVHLCIVDEDLVQMQAFLIEQTVKGESRNYVF